MNGISSRRTYYKHFQRDEPDLYLASIRSNNKNGHFGPSDYTPETIENMLE